jgi:hypothetical protein
VRLAEKFAAYGRVITKARRHRADLLRYLGRRPALLAANGFYEGALFLSSSVDNRLKALVDMKVSGRVGCPF